LVEEHKKLVKKMEYTIKTIDRLNYKIDRYEKAELAGVLSWDK